MAPPIRALLLSSEQLTDLFRHLMAELRVTQCDNTLSRSRAWASGVGIDPEALEAGIHRHGVTCDCQVVLYIYRTTPDSVPHSVVL